MVLSVRNVAGEIVAEYPDFQSGQAVRVLPDRVSDIWPVDAGSMVDDRWVFAGPTRHPYSAVVRDTEYGTTVHVERMKLQAL